MTEFTATLHTVIGAYDLTGASTPLFAKVFKGHPSALAPVGGRPVARWFTNGTIDAPEGARTLKTPGQRMVAAVFVIQCFWPLTAPEGVQQTQEDDIAETMIGLPADLIAIAQNTYTIAGKTVQIVTVDGLQPVNREFIFPNSDQEGIVLTITAHARILEAS